MKKLPVVASGLAVVGIAASLFTAPRTSDAMPVFAQATGLQCSACHTIVPLLNAYGRYVQRTAYTAIDRAQMVNVLPVWVSESVNYDTTAKANGTPQIDAGNLAFHAVGYALPDVTYHAQQWIVQGSAPGGLDTLWVADNHIAGDDAHLFFGKLESIGPSAYSQTSDIDGPMASSTVVGEHDWSVTFGNRWGTKVNLVRRGLDLEAGYLLSSDDLNGITDFNPGERTFQWRAAFAQPKSPLEFGAFGTQGTIPVSTGIDQYSSIAGYAQLDPSRNGVPGVLAIYQSQRDTNPGMAPAGGSYPLTSTRGFSAEIFEPFLHQNVMLSLRHDFNDAGITGGVANGNAINLAFNVPGTSYVHGYLEANLGANSALAGASGGPTWKGMLWLTLPLGEPRSR